MGVDVSAEVMIGIWFEDQFEAKDFILDNFNIDDYLKDGEDIEQLCLSELSECLESKYGICYKNYSEYCNFSGGCLGVGIGPDGLEQTGQGIINVWNKAFQEIPEEHHDKIKAHIWARYW